MTRTEAMCLFDSLPREVRDVLNYGNRTMPVELTPRLLQLVSIYGKETVARLLHQANTDLSTGSNLTS